MKTIDMSAPSIPDMVKMLESEGLEYITERGKDTAGYPYIVFAENTPQDVRNALFEYESVCMDGDFPYIVLSFTRVDRKFEVFFTDNDAVTSK